MLALPWNPRHFATGRMNSNPASSATRVIATMSSQSARQRSGARLMVSPPSQLALNTPSLNRLGPNSALFGPNRFKLGVFSANCDGGLTMSLAPERWRADWDDIVAMTRVADDAGLEFILPVAKWRGFQGKANIYGRSFETLTHGAALGALTKRIAIFSTVHVPLVTPAFGAKAIATIDHVTHGRAGLNIVCGWNQEEFDVHGKTVDAERRYDYGLEWFQIWSKLLEGGPEFDWD